MAVQTLSNFSAALRYLYDSDIVPQLNDNDIARKLRKKYAKDLNIQGLGAVIPIHGGRNYSGVMSTGEDGTLGTAGRQTPDQLIVPFKDIKGRFGITLETIKATESNKAAAVQALDFEKQRLIEDISRQRNRIFWGFGRGTLAVISAGASSTTQTVKDAMGVLNAQSSSNNVARFIQPEMVVSFHTGATLDSVRTVSSVSQSAGTFVLSATVATDTNDLVLLGTTATSDNSPYDKEPMGLLGLVDASTYLSTIFSFDRTAAGQTFFQSGVSTSVGTLSEDFLLRKIHNQELSGGKRVNQFFSGPDVLREYIKLSTDSRRYNSDGKAVNPDVGVGGAGMNEEMRFCGIPIAVDKDCPYGHLFGVNLDHLFFVNLDQGWEDPNNTGEILRRTTDKTSYEAVYYDFYNLVQDRGAVSFRLSGISSTVDSGLGISA